MKQIISIFRQEKLDEVKKALEKIGCNGITVIEVKGRGEQLGIQENYRGNKYKIDLIPKIKIETVVNDDFLDKTIKTISETAYTGNIGDGKIFVLNVEETIRIRTNEHGNKAV
ncbi:MAG: P-II family nitrogen regulator [Methanobacteriaceae archaeon]|nr:P-II family nitrogen regulator [Methanobacteriaceae archaeon]